MPKKVVEQKLIVVESVGTITELGGISGPILNPCYVPIQTINTMLNHHRVVMEVNPKNYNERVRLSLKNLRKKNFAEEVELPKAHVAPTIYTEATVTNSNSGKAKELKSDTSMVTSQKKPVQPQKPMVKADAEVKKEEKTETTTSDFTKKS